MILLSTNNGTIIVTAGGISARTTYCVVAIIM